MEKSFNTVITQLLGEKLKKFSEKDLNILTCVEIFQTIFDTLVSIFESAEIQISNEAMNYIAQSYYDCVLINNAQVLNPNIFTQRAKLENISTNELILLAVILNGTDFSVDVVKEVKRRS